MSRRKSRRLSPEEAALWESVAHTTRPMHPKQKFKTSKPLKTNSKKTAEKDVNSSNPKKSPQPLKTGYSKLSNPSKTPPSQPILMDQKAFSRMKRGRLKPEAKIDLHGMTLAEAHSRLSSFILRNYSDGKRLLLVVTGKGRNQEEFGTRGALNRQVPMWLNQPPFAHAVLQVNEAHRSHGGSGAYYVYLRRGKKA